MSGFTHEDSDIGRMNSGGRFGAQAVIKEARK